MIYKECGVAEVYENEQILYRIAQLFYSVRRLFTGLAIAAFVA